MEDSKLERYLPKRINRGKGLVSKIYPHYGIIQSTDPVKTTVHFTADSCGNSSKKLTDFKTLRLGSKVIFKAFRWTGDKTFYAAEVRWGNNHNDCQPNPRKCCNTGVCDPNKMEGEGHIYRLFPHYGFISIGNDPKNTVFFKENHVSNLENKLNFKKILKVGDLVKFKANRTDRKSSQWSATQVWVRKNSKSEMVPVIPDKSDKPKSKTQSIKKNNAKHLSTGNDELTKTVPLLTISDSEEKEANENPKQDSTAKEISDSEDWFSSVLPLLQISDGEEEEEIKNENKKDDEDSAAKEKNSDSEDFFTKFFPLLTISDKEEHDDQKNLSQQFKELAASGTDTKCTNDEKNKLIDEIKSAIALNFPSLKLQAEMKNIFSKMLDLVENSPTAKKCVCSGAVTAEKETQTEEDQISPPVKSDVSDSEAQTIFTGDVIGRNLFHQ